MSSVEEFGFKCLSCKWYKRFTASDRFDEDFKCKKCGEVLVQGKTGVIVAHQNYLREGVLC